MSFTTTTAESIGDADSVDDIDSLNEFDFGSESQSDSLQVSKRYWLGKKFMQFAQAWVFTVDSSPKETTNEIDASPLQVLQTLLPLTDCG